MARHPSGFSTEHHLFLSHIPCQSHPCCLILAHLADVFILARASCVPHDVSSCCNVPFHVLSACSGLPLFLSAMGSGLTCVQGSGDQCLSV